jgi:transcriptional regulator with XRE-family HTH domain
VIKAGDEPRRPQRAVTMQDVADRVGVSKAQVSMVFGRVQGPSSETRTKLATDNYDGSAWVAAACSSWAGPAHAAPRGLTGTPQPDSSGRTSRQKRRGSVPSSLSEIRSSP